MLYMFLLEAFSFIGAIWLMGNMYKQGKLTEQFSAILILTYLSIFLLTAFLLIPSPQEYLLIWAIITVVVWIIGYPFARWIYRQMLPPK